MRSATTRITNVTMNTIQTNDTSVVARRDTTVSTRRKNVVGDN